MVILVHCKEIHQQKWLKHSQNAYRQKKPDTLVFINNYNYDDTNKHKHTKQNCDRAGPEGRVGENSVGDTAKVTYDT